MDRTYKPKPKPATSKNSTSKKPMSKTLPSRKQKIYAFLCSRVLSRVPLLRQVNNYLTSMRNLKVTPKKAAPKKAVPKKAAPKKVPPNATPKKAASNAASELAPKKTAQMEEDQKRENREREEQEREAQGKKPQIKGAPIKKYEVIEAQMMELQIMQELEMLCAQKTDAVFARDSSTGKVVVTPEFEIPPQRLEELALQRKELIRQQKSTDRRAKKIVGRRLIQPRVDRDPTIKVEDEDKGSHVSPFATEQNKITLRKRRLSPVVHMEDDDDVRPRKRPMVVIPKKRRAHQEQFRELKESEDHPHTPTLRANGDPAPFSDDALAYSGDKDDTRHASRNRKISLDQAPTLTNAVTPGANINLIQHIGGPDITSNFDRAYPRLDEWVANHRRSIGGPNTTSSFDRTNSGLDETVANQTLDERIPLLRSTNEPTRRYTWPDTLDEQDDAGSLCDFVVDNEEEEEEEDGGDVHDEDYNDDLHP